MRRSALPCRSLNLGEAGLGDLIEFGKYDRCRWCKGTGIRKGSKKPCSACEGAGYRKPEPDLCLHICGCRQKPSPTLVLVCDDCYKNKCKSVTMQVE